MQVFMALQFTAQSAERICESAGRLLTYMYE